MALPRVVVTRHLLGRPLGAPHDADVTDRSCARPSRCSTTPGAAARSWSCPNRTGRHLTDKRGPGWAG